MSPRISRYKLKDSDRSGLTGFEISFVKDGPYKVMPEEFDTPPPSKKSLGGEGEVSGEFRPSGNSPDRGTLDTPSGFDNPTVYLTAAGGVSPSFTHPWMRVTGSNAAITITAQPAITRGREGQILTLQCVDSSFTLTHGSANAINLIGSAGSVTIRSGGAITFYYGTGNLAWNEASRTV